MKQRLIFILFALLFTLAVNAQFSDDFSDGDFTNNPSWQGETAKFKVNSSDQLQVQGSGVDTSYLSTVSTVALNCEWAFWAKQSFNSSDNNHSRIYLISSEANLKDSLHGYFVQFGSSDDNISLFRQDGYDTTAILVGSIHATSSSVNQFGFKITRDAAGNWELFADASGGTNYISEGSILDNSYTTSNYFGVFCKHTSSNATKIYFDDFVVGNIQVDTLPPSLNQVVVVDQQNIELHFSEALEPSAAQTASNFTVDNGVGSPVSASLNSTNLSIVELNFTNPFPSGVLLSISAQNIQDLKGNTAGTLTQQFAYYQVKEYDILINEIMADPSPVVSLPEWEYVELYNNSPFPIDMHNWTLKVGNADKTFTHFVFNPNSYLILCDDDAEADLASYGDVLSFSSFSLTNGGTSIILLNPNGDKIHHVVYDAGWYGSSIKEDGGWSLEMMDVENPCGCENNWKAATDLKGGTPGAINSVATQNPDARYPNLERISIVNPLTIRLYFSEQMDSNSVLHPNAYFVDNGVGSPSMVRGSYPDYKAVELQFSSSFQASTIYTISLKDSLLDCVGLHVDFEETLKFGLPEIPVEGDVVINEILFNPRDGGVDFVELYNTSDKIVDMRFLVLANWDDDLLEPSNQKQISEESWLLFPGEYLVLSTDGDAIKRHYYTKNQNAFLDMASFISMSNDEGEVLLLSTSDQVFDRIDYTEEMHYDLLVDVDGISLEKIHFERLSSDESNWHSAAESAGFATPGYLNSQFSEGTITEGDVSISPELFSPDNDGKDDVVNITLSLDESAQSCNIRIYDSRGRLVKSLASNAYIGTETVFTWDGTDDQRNKAGIGIYIVFIEVYDDQGNTQRFKRVVTLAGFI